MSNHLPIKYHCHRCGESRRVALVAGRTDKACAFCGAPFTIDCPDDAESGRDVIEFIGVKMAFGRFVATLFLLVSVLGSSAWWYFDIRATIAETVRVKNEGRQVIRDVVDPFLSDQCPSRFEELAYEFHFVETGNLLDDKLKFAYIFYDRVLVQNSDMDPPRRRRALLIGFYHPKDRRVEFRYSLCGELAHWTATESMGKWELSKEYSLRRASF